MSYRPSCTDTSVGAAARPGDTTRDQAVRLLVNYFETIAKKAGMTSGIRLHGGNLRRGRSHH